MLVDDNPDDNFFHHRVIEKATCTNFIIEKLYGNEALEHIKRRELHPELHPDLIFLDINMPGMNGWEFLEEYKKLPHELQSCTIVTMLTTSVNPEDEEIAKQLGSVSHFESKPLSTEILRRVLKKYFPDYL